MKDRYWFRHDYYSRNDDKIEAMLLEFGATGYGLYWCLVERLHEENNEIKVTDLFIKAVAKQMSTAVEHVLTFVNECSTTYQLFTLSKDKILSSNRVKTNLDEREKVRKQRSFAGKQSAAVKRSLTGVERPSTKERKGKEKKGKDIWGEWGDLIVAGNDQYWEQMQGRKITRSEMDSFLSVATRNGWSMENQQAFRTSLKGFSPNGQSKSNPNPGKI
jgi:hypothetical protein